MRTFLHRIVKIRKKICKSEKKVLSLQRKTQNKEKMETKETKQERVNPTWEAAMKTQGSIIINDPAWRI